MHHHQQIKVHLMLMEQANAAQRRRPGRPAAFIRTMVVLQRFVAFEAQPDNKAMFAEQSAPCVVDQRPVGLQAVADSHAVGGIARLQGERFVEAQAGQQRLAPCQTKLISRAPAGWAAI